MDHVANVIKNMACSSTDEILPCYLVQNREIKIIDIPISRFQEAQMIAAKFGIHMIRRSGK